MSLGETIDCIGNGIIWCQRPATVRIFLFLEKLLELMVLPFTAVNCSISDLPDLTSRTDVVTTDWDNVTTSFGTEVK